MTARGGGATVDPRPYSHDGRAPRSSHAVLDRTARGPYIGAVTREPVPTTSVRSARFLSPRGLRRRVMRSRTISTARRRKRSHVPRRGCCAPRVLSWVAYVTLVGMWLLRSAECARCADAGREQAGGREVARRLGGGDWFGAALDEDRRLVNSSSRATGRARPAHPDGDTRARAPADRSTHGEREADARPPAPETRHERQQRSLTG